MLDIKLIRDEKDFVIKRLNTRGEDCTEIINAILAEDSKRREILVIVEEMRNRLNSASKEIGLLKRNGEHEKAEKLMASLKDLSDEITDQDKKLAEVEASLNQDLLNIPNIPLQDVCFGQTEADNKVIKTVGEPKKFDFKAKDHVELGVSLGLLDFERASKIAGSRFAMLTGKGAKLERALINFMLDVQGENGYQEIVPPFLANSDSLKGTGQLPKFEEDLFKCRDDEYYLIPTAEVPLTNIHRGEFVKVEDLPIKYTAYTPCFRREAGSYGKDTHGLIRNHQFNKVEIVKLVKPENGEKELQALISDAAKILELLEIPYRIIMLCTGDTGFSAAKTYDLEVWMPSTQAYREISSCSIFSDFQARRLNIKYKDADKKTHFVYTLNGSALAVGRTFAAVLENYQDKNGQINIPKVLNKYFT